MSRDRGSATVWAALVTTVLGAVFGGVLLLGQAVVARHRAAAAADLAALAAATAWAHGPPAACAAARRVAEAQDAGLAGCAVEGETAEVTAEAATGPFTVRIRSRAGPAGASTRATRPGRWAEEAGEAGATPGVRRPGGG
ncbi:Rv3654c family TadE-like protein [Streptomyces sp. NPDC048603]|uniref:Rv3654c family TadE-like protein n=1 Tax=Streptomyces sp. NPDC048603 TaxID=3365577 RepID=UPI003723EAEF